MADCSVPQRLRPAAPSACSNEKGEREEGSAKAEKSEFKSCAHVILKDDVIPIANNGRSITGQ